MIDFKELEKDFNQEDIFQKIYETWDQLKFEHGTVTFPFYGGYQIDNHTLYEKSRPYKIVTTELIPDLRRYKGLSQQELARMLNVTVEEISDLEAGRRTDLMLLTKILDELL